MKVVDIDRPPRFAESAYIAALLTSVCRPALWVAPGLLIISPSISGSGAGKGRLARAAAAIAYGSRPSPFPAGENGVEFDKRVGAALLNGSAVVMPDNINGRILKSETLSSALTERPAEVRVLGYSKMLTLNAVAFVILTGNGLQVSEDLVRRLLPVPIDPKMDNPELRPFASGFLDEIFERRVELLEACLTILRWGRQAEDLRRGLPLGGFEQWAEWVRDPLLSLGCRDPVEEMLRSKQRDPERQELRNLYVKWREHHSSDPVTVADLHQEVLDVLNPQKKPRQWVARAVEKYVDARIGGFVLTRSRGGHWTAATYALVEADEGQYAEREADADAEGRQTDPMTPMTSAAKDDGAAGTADDPMTPMNPPSFFLPASKNTENNPITPMTPPSY
jgi:hypothetical protein